MHIGEELELLRIERSELAVFMVGSNLNLSHRSASGVEGTGNIRQRAAGLRMRIMLSGARAVHCCEDGRRAADSSIGMGKGVADACKRPTGLNMPRSCTRPVYGGLCPQDSGSDLLA